MGRRLEPILPIEGWEFPPGTTLSVESFLDPATFGSGAAQAIELMVLAGYRYKSVSVETLPGDEFTVDHLGARIMLVGADSTRDSCYPSPLVVPVALTEVTGGRGPGPLGLGVPLQLLVGGNQLYAETVDPNLVFMRGGAFRFCYTPDGTFEGDEFRNAIVPTLLSVIGVYSPCMTNGCLEEEQWHCYFSYRAEVEGSCRVDIRLNGGRLGWGVRPASTSKMLWTATWAQDQYIDEEFQPSAPQRCSDVVTGYSISPDETRFESASTTALGLQLDHETAAVMPSLLQESASNSLTVSVCYCPNFDSQLDASPVPCDHPSEYIQPIGVIYYWMVRVCDRDNWFACGVLGLPYSRVVPHQSFVLRVQCPPGGVCTGATESRLRFLAADLTSEVELPFWDRQERCKTTESDLATVQWLQADPAATGVDQSGGVRRDYKVWHLRYLVTTLPFAESFDVCYCDSGCEDPISFMKVGRVTTVDEISVAKWTQALDAPAGIIDPIQTVEFINKRGSITFFSGVPSSLTDKILPFDSVPFSRSAIMKPISFDRETGYVNSNGASVTLESFSGLDRTSAPEAQRRLDAVCGTASWSGTLMEGLDSELRALDYTAFIRGGPTSQLLAFSGAENDQSIVVLQAGVLVVCYCGMLGSTGACNSAEDWLAASRILVKGPMGGVDIILPTTYVTSINIEGWGFHANDTLRLIGMTQSCSENGNNPASSVDYRLGCPGVNASDCRLPGASEDIAAVIDEANSAGVFISSLTIGEYTSVLTFSGDITSSLLLDGDAITIDPDSVLLEGRNRSNRSLAEEHIVSKLTGLIPYADDPSSSRVAWLKVSNVYRVDGSLDPWRLSIPVGWPAPPPVLSFVNSSGIWVLRNRLRTRQELKANSPSTLKICWGTQEGGSQQYHAEAGVVRFSDPPAMQDAGVYYTSLVQGSVAPAIISFTPATSRTEYSSLQVPMVLRLLFRDVHGWLEPLLTGEPDRSAAPDPASEVPLAEASQALCGRLFAEMWSNDAGGFPVPRGCFYSRVHQDQGAVGDEMQYREYGVVFEPRAGLKSVCYDHRLSQTAPCIYSLVVQARVGHRSVSGGEDLVSIHSSCVISTAGSNPCGPPYSVIEYGAGRPRSSTLPAASGDAPQLGRVEMAIRGQDAATGTADGGRPVLWAREEPLELTGVSGGGPPDAPLPQMLDLVFRAYPREATKAFQRRAVLQLFFLPLTLWSVGSGPCDALCSPPPGRNCSDGRGGSVVECQQQAVTSTSFEATLPMQRNSIYMRFPRAMDIIESTELAHTIEVTSLALPSYGFFPVRFLAQLRDESSSNPSVVWVNGSFFRVPTQGASSGRLLFDGQVGSGPRPFAGERGNELLVRLTLGATLQHISLPRPENVSEEEALELFPPPTVQLLLPEGYTCSIQALGEADPTREIFLRDSDGDGYLDHYMGTLRSGEWSSAGGVCTFTLEPFAQVYAGQVFFVQIAANNPTEPLMRDDPKNFWRLSFRGTNLSTLGSTVPFISLAQELLLPGWVGNVAVLRPLQAESLQPSYWAEGAANDLAVFFQAVDDLPEWSLVLLDAPLGFDFTDECQVSDLPGAYYADWHAIAWSQDLTGPRSLTNVLGEGMNCTPDQWNRDVLAPPPITNFTRARVLVRRRLVSERHYGFLITVRNAHAFSQSQQDGWRLWILSPEGYPVDGSRVSVQFNPLRIGSLPVQLYDRSWGVFAEPLLYPLSLDFGSSSVPPTEVPLLSHLVTIHPFGVKTEGRLRFLRIVAPVGYEWDVDGREDFLGLVPGNTTRFCEIIAQPSTPMPNELVLPNLVLRVGCLHGFQVRIRIPARPPTRSMNAFFFEMGYDQTSSQGRESAGSVPAPPLRVIYDAQVYHLSSAAGLRENQLEFRLRTVSELGTNEGFVFQGDEMTRGIRMECWPVTVGSSLPLPSDAQCSIFSHEVTGLPMVILSATHQSFPAGFYSFRFLRVEMPNAPGERDGHWSMGTYGDVHLYPLLKVLDRAADVPAPRIRNRMQDAGLLTPSPWQSLALGRDDRPGALNQIIFYFRLFQPPLLPPSIPTIPLALRGPQGFIFEEHCLNGVTPLNTAHPLNMSLASNTNASFPCEENANDDEEWCPAPFKAWPQLLQPVGCWGSHNSAMISVPNLAHIEDQMDQAPPDNLGFVAGETYAIRISTTNPFRNYDPTMWAVDFGDEASKPFSSIVLKTFGIQETVLRPASRTVSSPMDVATVGNPNAGYFPINVLFMPATEVPAPRVGLEDPFVPIPDGALQGSITLTAPAVGFAFRFFYDGSDGTNKCLEVELEPAGYQPGDATTTFSVDTDFQCFVNQENELRVAFIGGKVLQAGVLYRLIARVRNPMSPTAASPWVLLSHVKEVRVNNEIPLDRFTFPGFAVAAALARWTVDNDSQEFMGDKEVQTVSMVMGFNRPVLNGESISVVTASGVSFGTGGVCSGFQWTNIQPPAWLVPLPNSPSPVCFCEGGQCTLQLNITEGANGEVAVEAGQELLFKLSAINPSGPPDVMDNFWMAQHKSQDGELLASRISGSWQIYGQLRDVAVDITGVNLQAGSTTDLTVDFTPAVFASFMDLEFHEPPGMNFVTCEPSSPLLVDRARTAGSRLVVSNGNFHRGVRTRVQLSQVVMGTRGGQTRVSILLYQDILQSPVVRRLNFLGGFRAPGRLNITEQRLWSQAVVDHHELGVFDEVVPLLPPHSGLLARLDMFFHVTDDVQPGETLFLNSTVRTPNAVRFQPRVDAERPATLVACLGGATPEGCSSSLSLGFSQVTVSLSEAGSFAYGFIADLNATSRIEANRLHRLRFWCIPSEGTLYWSAATQDNGPLPTNTNDDSEEATGAVAVVTMDMELFGPRMPPESVVPVRITLRTGLSAANFGIVRLVFPRGFVQFGMQPVTDPQNAARIVIGIERSVGSGDPQSSAGWTIEMSVVTPNGNVTDARWFALVSAAGQADWGISSLNHVRMLGWGSYAGFDVVALPVRIAYAGAPMFSGWFALSFQLPMYMQAKYTLIGAPEGFQLSCPEESNLRTLVCSRTVSSRIANAGDTSRVINVTLPPPTVEGTNRLYSFIMGISTPENVEVESLWSVRIVDAELKVVDSALNVLGRSFNPSMLVENPSLSWDTQPQSGETSTATIEITLRIRIRHVKALLISLPEKYRHDVQHPNQIQSMNKQLPLAVDEEWRNYDNVRWIRLLLATGAGDADGRLDYIPAGTFQFRFPVMVPVEQPYATEWYFSLCTAIFCQSPDDGSVAMTFPVVNTRPIQAARTFSAGLLPVTALAARTPTLRTSAVIGTLIVLTLRVTQS